MNCVLLGYGTVGRSVEALCKNLPNLNVTKVFVRPSKADEPYFSANGEAMVTDPKTDVVFECMGGLEPANTLIRKALENGKHVISSNKAVISRYLPEYLEIADKNGGSLQIEACVGGGIPIIDGILKLSRAEELKGFEGILNGTSNFILTSMEKEGAAFDDVLKAVIDKGYAEADPTSDIEGIDVWYKTLIVLELLTHSAQNDLPQPIGISKISADDIEFAKKQDRKIRHIAKIKNESGKHAAIIAPFFIPEDHLFAGVDANYNAQLLMADSFGSIGYYGQGAGGFPTAQAMVADALNLLDGSRRPIRLDSSNMADPELMKLNWIVRSKKDLSSVDGVKPNTFEENDRYFIQERSGDVIEEVRSLDPEAMIGVWA